MYKDDTIAAISTAQGAGAVGIVRISGNEAFDLAEKIFRGKNQFSSFASHTINYGKIVNPSNGETVDEVLVSKMNAPKTFTGENIVEINCHGGTVMVNRILELVLREGARLAEPGEFTRRAFLNGRMDLSQAEAVVDIINSKTKESSKAALNQLEGKLSSRIKAAVNVLVKLLSHIEAVIDFPDQGIDDLKKEEIDTELKFVKEMLVSILKGFERGRIIREGINAVIVGRTNVGKSSLLNELTGKNRAIVTDIPGTTRDILEEYVNIHGIPVRMTDTAGIRETEDVVERIGVEKARKAVEEADLAIMMIDGQKGLTKEDKRIMDKLHGKKVIVIINKIDLSYDKKIRKIEKELESMKIVRTSMTDGVGIDYLEDEIRKLFVKGDINPDNEIIITNTRHKKMIDYSIESIDLAINGYESGMPIDCITIDIKDAAEYLGRITGQSVGEDVLDNIFKRFCIGK